MPLFGPNKREVWGEFSKRVGGELVAGGMWKVDTVRWRIDCWDIVMDTHTVSSGETSETYTRLRARLVSRDGFRFHLYRAGLFTSVGVFFGMQDIEIGDPEFDEMFVVKSEQPERVRALLANEHLRKIIRIQPSIDLRIVDDEGRFGPVFGEHVDELIFLAPRIIRDIALLDYLNELFGLTLRRLVEIGSAYDADPALPVIIPDNDMLVRGAAAPPDGSGLLRAAQEPEDSHPAQLPRPSSKP